MNDEYSEEDLYKLYMEECLTFKDISLITNYTENKVKTLIKEYKNSLKEKYLHDGNVGDIIECSINNKKILGKVFKCYENSVLINILDKDIIFEDLLYKSVINNRNYIIVESKR